MSDFERWEKRYGAPGYLFGTAPNAFLAAQADRLRGRKTALSVADGEGRNGVWLAEQGLDVLAIDYSPTALAKAETLARERGVRLHTEVADLTRWHWPRAAFDVIAAIFAHTGRAYVIGVTGPPGAGKSTLVDRLTLQFRGQGRTVGVIAVDPSSPFTGGAVLGDRLRMQSHSGDEGVFIRSMATRGNLGGLVGPLVVGFMVDRWHSWTYPFYVTAAVYVMGALAWLAIDPRRRARAGRKVSLRAARRKIPCRRYPRSRFRHGEVQTGEPGGALSVTLSRKVFSRHEGSGRLLDD